MHEPDFASLGKKLLKRGIAPRYAQRAVCELQNHYDDIVDAAIEQGKDPRLAQQEASESLGSFDYIINDMDSRRELKTWVFRYPGLAAVVYPLACLALLPAMPVFAGVAHREALARWGTSLLAAGFVTAALMLTMQLSILLG